MELNLSYSLPVTIFKEGDAFVAYSPALDLSTAGLSEQDAKRMFEEATQLFFEELAEMGTTESVLTDLGWEKEAGVFQPPMVVQQSMMQVRV
ncbi:hypothetical protein A3C09_00580 [Candidatus Uhrbacteria bacterium RIFCSPHIGHO2_02_FULL_47_44]|uniref:HicB-like antitoxin of toxin-antitoxin system domain-containing protein n=1 Tax=Candidatus Uhrbacteria bacterium RIFCSPLOWO2_02_FULL_48_18 TaxID=1802408 RepID=A0A1F7V8G5_9BACT|nr:MAG: hypothetical protein A2839_01635 [Candidatus Uhrbacteria bacterium RIFCSPHIGHO2_01_FULL_47_10]OGL70833.1 MAG: hypothetical protein A3C09_00580 [Candidatus Uhrbacteria bacterium RIFCSPHIGHO2_02_FULL_47_44]OGL76685.1 MAG: hypothetical protein A3E97_02100 [Candidatus Uhrbacteria bacterium RIFCSPHIGHO2_12_FULL_47_12]OGL82592.1 MAG: hypothetical protein A3B20_00100 [Candidatus Uhrbacteria bacterium RIFCSPLOWO2_01_FULL_47_17]OGL86803.1 MAG: hypothetical protein A3I41_04470 [Candidatus Uhrbact